MPRVNVNGTEIAYSVAGTGPAAVFVHGSGCDGSLWYFQTQELTKHFSVVAIDLNGHGQSPLRAGNALESYVEDVLAVLDALSVSVLLVGHSLGSAVVQTIALRKPENVAAIGLIGAGAKLRVHPTIFETVDADFPKAVELILQWSFTQPVNPTLIERAREQMVRHGPVVLARDFRACDSFNVMERISEIALPTLIVCGRQDQLTPLKYSEHLKNQISRAELQVIDGAGHRVMEEQPASVNRALREFMRNRSKLSCQ
jgi:pimeloyl-ACP methyl ester carboxylesterase